MTALPIALAERQWIDLRSGVAVVDRLLAFLLPTGESAGRSAESH